MEPNDKVHYKKAKVDGINIFYREAGNRELPTLLLLHGYPSSSHMFRDLIPLLANDYHIIAPDYPGFGHSDMPPRQKFAYTFDNYANVVNKLLEQLKIKHFAMYIFDYGAPVGLRLFQKDPSRVTAIVVQNGNAYEAGITNFWDPIKKYWKTHAEKERAALRGLTSLEVTQFQYHDGVPANMLQNVSPDGWVYDQCFLDRPGNEDIQLDLFYDYKNNITLYPKWQEALKKHQPPVLVVWGKNDKCFAVEGGAAFKQDLPNAEIHLLDTGHFALETHLDEIASLMKAFLRKHVGLAALTR